MMYVRIGGEQKKSAFVIELTTQIMKKHINARNNPLSKLKESMLSKIFNGERQLSQKNARFILCEIDPERFETYLSGFSDNVYDMLLEDMGGRRGTLEGYDVINACTDLLVAILNGCARGVKEGIDSRQLLQKRMDSLKDDEVFTEVRKILLLAQKDIEVANKLREIFTCDDEDYHITEFINVSIANRIAMSDVNSNENNCDDIQGLMETIYESCVETGEYEDTTQLLKCLHDYIVQAANNASFYHSDESTQLRKEIISLLVEIQENYIG